MTVSLVNSVKINQTHKQRKYLPNTSINLRVFSIRLFSVFILCSLVVIQLPIRTCLNRRSSSFNSNNIICLFIFHKKGKICAFQPIVIFLLTNTVCQQYKFKEIKVNFWY